MNFLMPSSMLGSPDDGVEAPMARPGEPGWFDDADASGTDAAAAPVNAAFAGVLATAMQRAVPTEASVSTAASGALFRTAADAAPVPLQSPGVALAEEGLVPAGLEPSLPGMSAPVRVEPFGAVGVLNDSQVSRVPPTGISAPVQTLLPRALSDHSGIGQPAPGVLAAPSAAAGLSRSDALPQGRDAGGSAGSELELRAAALRLTQLDSRPATAEALASRSPSSAVGDVVEPAALSNGVAAELLRAVQRQRMLSDNAVVRYSNDAPELRQLGRSTADDRTLPDSLRHPVQRAAAELSRSVVERAEFNRGTEAAPLQALPLRPTPVRESAALVSGADLPKVSAAADPGSLASLAAPEEGLTRSATLPPLLAAELASHRAAGELSFDGSPAAQRILAERLAAAGQQGGQVLRLVLHPRELGEVAVRIERAEGGDLSLTFLASQSAARELLESSMPRLRSMLEEQGLRPTELDVRSGNDGQRSDRGDPSAGFSASDRSGSQRSRPQPLRTEAEAGLLATAGEAVVARSNSSLLDAPFLDIYA